MPFRDHLEPHFALIKQCCEQLGLEATRVDTYGYSGNILQGISKALSKADLIVADLSSDNPNDEHESANPNVMYELAISHCLGKKVMLITNDRNTVPFDVMTYRVELIDPASDNQAERLCQAMQLILDATYIIGPLGGTVVFGQNLFFRRLAAFLVDLFAVLFVSLLIISMANSLPAYTDAKSFLTNLLSAVYNAKTLGLSILLYILYAVVSTCTLGGTIGQRLFRIKVVTMDGDRLSFLRSLGRIMLAIFLGACTYGIGFLWGLRGPSFRTFHDITSQTMIVKVSKSASAQSI
jgi:uncharacterized RDD family membrane protein YckC